MSDPTASQAPSYPRVAIVTGATSGIGEAIARSFVAQGIAVVGNGRSADKLTELERELGATFRGVAGDAGDAALIERLFETAADAFGRSADIVVVNAGRGLGGSVKDADLGQFEDVLRINLSGALNLMQQAARVMVEKQATDYPQKPADIVVIGSVVGKHISPFSAVYGSTKFAVHSLAEGLRREIGPKGVRVTLVEPGIVISGFQAVAGYADDMVGKFEDNWGPLLYGEDIANAVQFVVDQPPHVHVSEIMVRPTRQDYP
ncbi:short-chain dehydrogenase [Halothiobacillus diazotrophicus]|uniref:Short-chain dehydrogenase n=1 Tax=Halothiobacillus diazotrophicus TaxID=1860122 RepID=A0A191ZEB0_9GAMM|nr:SDR family oxidoreductase [Halothiobacillus diazotrophicus]ANJ66211.1 short-chain dehydrogenase [Halothiobacillus diazotrophicus]